MNVIKYDRLCQCSTQRSTLYHIIFGSRDKLTQIKNHFFIPRRWWQFKWKISYLLWADSWVGVDGCRRRWAVCPAAQLCIHNCNTRPGVVQARTELTVSLGPSPSCRAAVSSQSGENEKFKQFHCYLSSTSLYQHSWSDLIIDINLSRKMSVSFNLKILKIMSEMSGVSFLISFPQEGIWPAL